MAALKRTNPGLKVMAAIGGYNAGGERFSNMARTAGGRATFISSVLFYLLDNNLDGLDMDWEFPLADDRDTFTALIMVISSSFCCNHLLSLGVRRVDITHLVTILSKVSQTAVLCISVALGGQLKISNKTHITVAVFH